MANGRGGSSPPCGITRKPDPPNAQLHPHETFLFGFFRVLSGRNPLEGWSADDVAGCSWRLRVVCWPEDHGGSGHARPAAVSADFGFDGTMGGRARRVGTGSRGRARVRGPSGDGHLGVSGVRSALSVARSRSPADVAASGYVSVSDVVACGRAADELSGAWRAAGACAVGGSRRALHGVVRAAGDRLAA